jgi:RNA polymerase sigma factor (sigma-70 family)
MPDQIAAYCNDRINRFPACVRLPARWLRGAGTDLRHATQQAERAWKGHAMGDGSPDSSPVNALVARVSGGDQQAWNELVERYAPLVWSICQRYQLTRQDIDDVSQSVWLLLVENIASLREAAALPGWLSTTTRHEIFRVLRVARRHDHDDLPADGQIPGDADAATIEEELILAERNAALRAAFAELGPNCHQLLSLLMSDPPLAYTDISDMLGIPVGSIGPKRARCLSQLRRSPHLTEVVNQPAKHAEVKETRR